MIYVQAALAILSLIALVLQWRFLGRLESAERAAEAEWAQAICARLRARKDAERAAEREQEREVEAATARAAEAAAWNAEVVARSEAAAAMADLEEDAAAARAHREEEAFAAREARAKALEDKVTDRIKAEVGKWVFGTGAASGHVAIYQYCSRCATRTAKWRMVPDEGPVCEVCCGKDE